MRHEARCDRCWHQWPQGKTNYFGKYSQQAFSWSWQFISRGRKTKWGCFYCCMMLSLVRRIWLSLACSFLSTTLSMIFDRVFLTDKHHTSRPNADRANLTLNASVKVISNSNEALSIISLISKDALPCQNAILACGKHLKNTHVFISPNLPKDVQTARKSLRPFFLVACTAYLKAYYHLINRLLSSSLFSLL